MAWMMESIYLEWTAFETFANAIEFLQKEIFVNVMIEKINLEFLLKMWAIAPLDRGHVSIVYNQGIKYVWYLMGYKIGMLKAIQLIYLFATGVCVS